MTLRAGAFVFAALMSAPIVAAELGDISVRSYIGQQLSADIELVSLTPEDISGLQVKLAQQNVYQGANITMNPALAGVHLSVVRRDQRQFLHVTTLQPVDADYLHLFLELNTGSRHEVRAATLWLQADPHPAPPPAPMPVATPAAPPDAAFVAARARASRPAPPARVARVAKAAPVTPPVMEEAPAQATAAEARPAVTAAEARKEPVPAEHKESHAVVAPKELAAAISARLPAPKPAPKKVEASAAHAAAPVADKEPAAPVLPAAVAKAPPLQGAVAPAACAPAGISSKECAALDAHNTALTTKLGELEGKLKVLQMAVEGKPASGAAPAAAKRAGAASAAASAAAVSAQGSEHAAAKAAAGASAKGAVSASADSGKPSSAQHSASTSAAAEKALAAADAALGLPPASAKASVPAKTTKVLPKLKYKKEKPVDTGMKTSTMAAIGAGALALLGGLGWWIMKRRKAQGSAPLKIWQGWRKKKTPEPAPEPPQPLHEVTPESLLQPE